MESDKNGEVERRRRAKRRWRDRTRENELSEDRNMTAMAGEKPSK